MLIHWLAEALAASEAENDHLRLTLEHELGAKHLLEAEVERLRAELADERDTFRSFAEHHAATEAIIERLRDTTRAILANYADEMGKDSCDRCEECGEMVMCQFHSLLSMVSGETEP